MGDRSAHDPARPARRAQTVGERARGSERDLLRAVDRLPMEGAAQGSAAIRLAMIASCSGGLPQMPRHESKLLGWALSYEIPIKIGAAQNNILTVEPRAGPPIPFARELVPGTVRTDTNAFSARR